MKLGPHPNLLDRLDADSRRRLLLRSRRRTLAAGETLFVQGEALARLYIVSSGRLRIYYLSGGGQTITFAYWQAGTLVGTPCIHRGFDRHYWTGEAAEPTELLSFDRGQFVAMMKTNPDLAMGVVEALEFKAKCLTNLFQLHTTSSVKERLRLALINMMDLYGEHTGEGIVITAPFSHSEIAQLVGASRQWVTHELGQLQREGIVRARNRRVIILRPDAAVFGLGDLGDAA